MDDKSYKILIVGNSGVGKTSFLLRFIDGTFSEKTNSTIGIDFKVKKFKVDESTTVNLEMWDTAGNERYQSLTKSYYKDGNGAFIIYDITNESSYSGLKTWVDQVSENSPKNIAKCIIGNKVDKEDERIVLNESGVDFARSVNVPFFETSAKTNTNINECMIALVKQMIETRKNPDGIKIDEEEDSPEIVNIKEDIPEKKKKKCCK